MDIILLRRISKVLVHLFSTNIGFSLDQFDFCVESIVKILCKEGIQICEHIMKNLLMVIAKIISFTTNELPRIEEFFLDSLILIVNFNSFSRYLIMFVKYFTQKNPIRAQLRSWVIEKLSYIVQNYNGTILMFAAESLSNIIIRHPDTINLFIETNVLVHIMFNLRLFETPRRTRRELAFTLILCFTLLTAQQRNFYLNFFN